MRHRACIACYRAFIKLLVGRETQKTWRVFIRHTTPSLKRSYLGILTSLGETLQLQHTIYEFPTLAKEIVQKAIFIFFYLMKAGGSSCRLSAHIKQNIWGKNL